ncbi:MAG: 30S ribosomal protein S17 [Elusimicrobiota bacterium]
MNKTKTGIVISDKMNRTRVVEVTRTTHFPLYGKVVKRTTRFYAHDEQNKTKTGDKVTIAPTRPLSKLKRWRIVKAG